ncbi:TIGR02117 family protein [Sphaerotilaceae bacterium SBD11-9]
MWSALGVMAGVAAYFMVAFGLLLVPANPQAPSDAIVVQAYVVSNGVHTDLVFPLRAQGVDWSRTFPARHLAQDPGERARYVAIGWGDREFYLHTPRWRDLTAGRALQALSGSGHSLLHVTHLHETDLREGAYALPLTAAQYASLVQHVEASLVRRPSGEGAHLPGQHYGPRDAFYEARGSYDLFTTCNVWTGRALRQAGVKVSVWTPLASQVVWYLPAAR